MLCLVRRGWTPGSGSGDHGANRRLDRGHLPWVMGPLAMGVAPKAMGGTRQRMNRGVPHSFDWAHRCRGVAKGWVIAPCSVGRVANLSRGQGLRIFGEAQAQDDHQNRDIVHFGEGGYA